MENNSMLDPTISMNANNSEIVQCLSDDSDFEIEITDGYFHNTINIDIIPKSNTIKFRRNPECDHVTESDKCDLVVASGRHEAYKTSSVVETKQPNAVLDRPEENGSEEVLSEDINGSDFIGWSDDGPGESETDEIDNIEIEIVDGECPGTVSINIVCDVPEINKGKGSTCLEQEHAKYEHTKNGKITSCTQQCQADESYCSSVYGSVNSQTNPDVDARAESMKLRMIDEDKLFTPKSDLLFSDLDDSLKRDACLKEEFQSEEQHISKNYQRFEILYDASEIISATQNENDIKLENVDLSVNVESKNKRNQRFSLEADQEKRFKVTNSTFVSKRQTNTGTGDFFQKRKSTNKRDETNSCILDDIDAVIPRVIPKSGKQVKFGDEISGNRLIQLSPEKRQNSDVISPNKAERSILKNSNPPQGSNIEAQVYYNSSYFNDNSDGNDDNLNDYSQPEHQNKEHQSPRKLVSYSESSISSYKQPATSCRQINGQQYFRSYHTYTRYYQPSKPRVDFNSANFSILKRSKDEKMHNANTSCTPGKYHTDNKYSVLIKPPGSYTNTTNKNRVNHSPVSGFMTSGSNSSENNLSSTGNQKHSSRDKKKQQKKRGKPVTAETDIERFQRYLSTGQAKLTSKGHLDTRRLKLEYLLHIGDFSLKYKTEAGCVEPTTITIYSDMVGSSLDVRHMLNMKSNFINRVRFALRRGSEIWLVHKFLHLGALQVLLNRDPNRAVLGEVHSQFITAGLLIGINYLHQNGITHGNLYPWKVLINNRGYPVLTGFLSLQDKDDPVTRELQERNSCTFAIPYAAPDRFLANMDPSVDIFSIGCIAYEIVAGRTPFCGGSEERTKENILSYSYRPMYDYEIFSFAGEMFIDSCLRKNNDHRFVPGHHLSNLYLEEWFSTLDLGRYEDQQLESPLLQVLQLLHEGETLELEERNLDYSWGQIMDIVSPHTPAVVY